MFADNNSYTNVVLADDPPVKKSGATINERDGTWTAPHPSDPAKLPQTRKIGESRYFEVSCWGVIGVYDCTKLEHLNSMVRDSQGATDNTPPFLAD